MTAKRRVAIIVLLWVAFAQLLGAATHLSATIDEGFHITSGYEYLRTGHLRLFDEHTPLVKALFAWPLFFVPDLAPPEQTAGYAGGNLIAAAQETVLAYRPLDRVIVACRIPVALLTLLLAASVCRWATRLGGAWAGLLALALFAFDPNLLAHGSLATTDMGATAFVFWATLGLADYLRNPTQRGWWQAALLLGLALGTKLTALMLLPVNGVLMLLSPGIPASPRPSLNALARRALSYAGMVAVASLVLWALYGFELRPLPQIAGSALPIPAASHVERGLRLQANLTGGRESFLLGENRTHGWWYYFPVAFALKTPLPAMILLVVALARLSGPAGGRVSGSANHDSRLATRDSRVSRVTFHASRFISKILHPASFFPCLYAVAALFSTFNIGYRHLLPVLPFLYVGIGQIANGKSQTVNGKSAGQRANESASQRISGSTDQRISESAGYESRISRFTLYVSRFILLVLVLWQTAGTLWIGPHYLTFFNEIAGRVNGWRYLADSNTDWGQGYKALAQYQAEHNLDSVRLASFVFYDPAAYGVTYTALTPLPVAETPAVFTSRLAPPPGDYVIGATVLDGIPLADPEMYDWFRQREPDAVIAGALHYYHI
ncbi:MAG: glycosyltransferase family 39 protein, partial [Anaerolineae bacterium]|nr:glycosyltransferase family 39 protein [Anaerolineae bacterium]